MSESVTISKAQHDIMQRAALTLDQLLGRSDTASQTEDLVRKLNPDAKFPRREMLDSAVGPVREELTRTQGQLTALEKRLQERDDSDAQRKLEDGLARDLDSVKSKRGFSDDAMTRVMERMREKNNPDVEAAAAWVADQLPKPPPMTPRDGLPTGVDVFGTQSLDDKWKDLHANPDRWLTNELREIARDPEFARLGAA